jgi:hypothetical protein
MPTQSRKTNHACDGDPGPHGRVSKPATREIARLSGPIISNYCYLSGRAETVFMNSTTDNRGPVDRTGVQLRLCCYACTPFSTAYFSAIFANDATIKGNTQNKDIPLSFSDLQWSTSPREYMYSLHLGNRASRLEWIHPHK